MEMKKKIMNFHFSKYAQHFSNEVPVYKLVDGEPKQVDKKDLTEMLNSNRDCELSRILDKYTKLGIVDNAGTFSHSYSLNDFSDEVVDDNSLDDLHDYAEALKGIDDLRGKYNLPLSMSHQQVIKEVIRLNNGAVDSINKALSKANLDLKEGENNEEKKIDETSKQKEL